MHRVSVIQIIDLVRATWELALARRRLSAMSPSELLAIAYGHDDKRCTDRSYALRVRLAVGRMSCRVPWRASCLVQALAARRWLSRRGIEASLFVGVRKEAGRMPEAHAWLVSGEDVITGGDVSGYRELLSPQVIGSLKANRLLTSPQTP